LIAAPDGRLGNTHEPWERDRPAAGTRPVRSLGVAKPARLGRFQILENAGSGSTSTVYRAYDPELDRVVALKVPHRSEVAGDKSQARFVSEARALARLSHPAIVPVYEAGRSGGTPYLATAYVGGSPLSESLRGGPFAPPRAAAVAAELAEALYYAHGLGVVHRDVKPANVLVECGGAVRLTDFGLALRPGERRPGEAGAVTGTPAYLAPELAGGDGTTATAASDQYSLGVVLYEMLCGRPPFLGPPALVLYYARTDDPTPPSVFRPGIPRSLERICLRALLRHPSRRYPSCGALAEALRAWSRRGRIATAVEDGSLGRALELLGGPRAVAASAALALVASSVLAAALFVSLEGPVRHDGPGTGTGPVLARSTPSEPSDGE
jgi:serine/threonine-protein kinase